jgi:hypothetical protein
VRNQHPRRLIQNEIRLFLDEDDRFGDNRRCQRRFASLRLVFVLPDMAFVFVGIPMQPMQHLCELDWGHWPSVKKAREKFDATAAHEAAVLRIKRVAL